MLLLVVWNVPKSDLDEGILYGKRKRSNKIAKGFIDELEHECLTAVRYIEALKVTRLSKGQREELLGDLSACITHLRIQTEHLDTTFENTL